MSSSRKQWILFAIAGGIFAVVMVAGIAGNVARGNYLAIPVVLGALLFAILAIWIAIWLNQRRVQLMFRKPTPESLIAHYHATEARAAARKIPNADAAAAHLSALAAAIYGQYDRAREELAAVDWDAAPAAYRAQRMDTLALMALLEKQDVAAALKLAREAGGANTILRDAVFVAAGEGDAETLKRTQNVAERAVGALPAVSAWAVSLYMSRNNQTARAAEYAKHAREAAPHFVGLAHPPA